MNEVPIITKIIILLILLTILAISAFLSWRVLKLTKRIEDVQKDRNELEDERRKQSNKLRLKGIEMNEASKKEFILSTIEKKIMLVSLNMPEYKKAIEDPKTSFNIRKAYRLLKEKIKESIDE